jgi:hypothetical protein
MTTADSEYGFSDCPAISVTRWVCEKITQNEAQPVFRPN